MAHGSEFEASLPVWHADREPCPRPMVTVPEEVWGVQHFDVHPLELLGSGEVTVP